MAKAPEVPLSDLLCNGAGLTFAEEDNSITTLVTKPRASTAFDISNVVNPCSFAETAAATLCL